MTTTTQTQYHGQHEAARHGERKGDEKDDMVVQPLRSATGQRASSTTSTVRERGGHRGCAPVYYYAAKAAGPRRAQPNRVCGKKRAVLAVGAKSILFSSPRKKS
jgi:hypothetical protein